MKGIFAVLALIGLSQAASADEKTPALRCQNLHDQSSEFELSSDHRTAVLIIHAADGKKNFQMECTGLESESFSVACQDAGMPSIYQVIITKNQDRAFLYEYGYESAVIMSDLYCQK